MDGGYPAEADILTFLSGLGIEEITENNPNFILESRQQIWAMLNAARWAMALGVYCPSTTTFNVRSGDYRFNGQLKSFAAGSAIDPTDNDTTYIWMDSDNTIDSAIDGTGWPATDHIKLAEIDVASDGVITDVRDLRGQGFMQHMAGSYNLAAFSAAGGAVPFILKASIADGATVAIHNADAPFKYQVIDAWSIATSADGGTWKITDGTNDITDTVTVAASDNDIDRASQIDNAYHEIAASGSLSVVGDGSTLDGEVYIKCIRV
ncbi:MAG: hypothetical protein FVQ82_13000 [Planctomycetes bacterium]|nr:hypothetical protein [Planctomycetota bacterium]